METIAIVALLAAVACLQAATLAVVLVGINFRMRAWQLPVVGKLFKTRYW